jgi:hypothetical protein
MIVITVIQSASFSIHKTIRIMLKIAEIVLLGETMIKRPLQDNHSISSHYDQLMELIN